MGRFLERLPNTRESLGFARIFVDAKRDMQRWNAGNSSFATTTNGKTTADITMKWYEPTP
jgi:hypothetical protein